MVVQAAEADLAVEQVVQVTLQQLLHHKEIMVALLRLTLLMVRVVLAAAVLAGLVY
jgi:hypothetical protein